MSCTSLRDPFFLGLFLADINESLRAVFSNSSLRVSFKASVLYADKTRKLRLRDGVIVTQMVKHNFYAVLLIYSGCFLTTKC